LEKLSRKQSAKAALILFTPLVPPANYCGNSSNFDSTPSTPPTTKKLSRKTVKVGDTIDYFAPHSVVGVSNNMCSGVVTSIFPTHSLEEMTDTHLELMAFIPLHTGDLSNFHQREGNDVTRDGLTQTTVNVLLVNLLAPLWIMCVGFWVSSEQLSIIVRNTIMQWNISILARYGSLQFL
jgi:hypothetical protein